MTNYENNNEYLNLVKQWEIYKRDEKYANEKRIEIEKKICELVKPDLKEKGTNNFPEGLQITTGETVSVDNARVNQLFQEYVMSGVVDMYSIEFPFKIKFEYNNKLGEKYKSDNLQSYNLMIAPLLTTKPKKPSFTIK